VKLYQRWATSLDGQKLRSFANVRKRWHLGIESNNATRAACFAPVITNREYLAQAFARYFMRVGLPLDAKAFEAEGQV